MLYLNSSGVRDFIKLKKSILSYLFFFLAIFLHFIFYHTSILYPGISFNPKPQATDLSVHFQERMHVDIILLK